MIKIIKKKISKIISNTLHDCLCNGNNGDDIMEDHIHYKGSPMCPYNKND